MDGDLLKTFDYVVANPPFSDKRWSTGIDPLHDPHERFKPFGTPPAKQGDYAYLLHIVRSLKSHGKAIEYEEYLLLIAQLTKRVQAGQAEDTPRELNTPGKRALYSNLFKDMSQHSAYDPATPNPATETALKDRALALAQKIDQSVKRVKFDDWRGNTARENAIKTAIYEVLQDHKAVDEIFPILVQQREY